jgi:hypothetical protein
MTELVGKPAPPVVMYHLLTRLSSMGRPINSDNTNLLCMLL